MVAPINSCTFIIYCTPFPPYCIECVKVLYLYKLGAPYLLAPNTLIGAI